MHTPLFVAISATLAAALVLIARLDFILCAAGTAAAALSVLAIQLVSSATPRCTINPVYVEAKYLEHAPRQCDGIPARRVRTFRKGSLQGTDDGAVETDTGGEPVRTADDVINELFDAAAWEVPQLVSRDLRTVSSPAFFVRVAERVDAATTPEQKDRLTALADTVMHTLEVIVQRTEEKVDSSGETVRAVVAAAAEEDGDFRLPLTPAKNEAVRAELHARRDSLDEGFLSTLQAWTRKADDDGLDGMATILRRVMQLYAATALATAPDAPSPTPAGALVDNLVYADPARWDADIARHVFIDGSAANSNYDSIDADDLLAEIQARIECVVLAQPAGSYAQRVQAEFAKELADRIRLAMAAATRSSTTKFLRQTPQCSSGGAVRSAVSAGGFSQDVDVENYPSSTTRRGLVSNALVAVAASAMASRGTPADAFGPVSMDLNDITYKPVECPPTLKAGRLGGSFGGATSQGIFQQCIEVNAMINNPNKTSLKEVAVFGYVVNKDGNSVIANNPDLRSDAGQFAQINKVAPGKSKVSFIFVATFGNEFRDNLPPLDFRSLKGISYPGGARYVELNECELDSVGCAQENDDE